MFLHIDFLHMLFNMLWLFWFGKIFLEFLSSKQLVMTYLIGVIACGVVYILAVNIFPVFHSIVPESLALGASASVMAIVTAISFFVPNYSIQLIFLGRIKIIYIAIILFVLDFFAIPSGNPGGHLAHIGGALWGFIYVLTLKRRVGNTVSSLGFSSLFNRIKQGLRFSQHQKPSSPADQQRPMTDEEYNFNKIQYQKKIDEILDKIAKGGYDSLTKDEKEFLFKSSGKK